jgi:hypothetical protein
VEINTGKHTISEVGHLRLFFFKPDIEIPGGSGKKTGQTVIEDCA